MNSIQKYMLSLLIVFSMLSCGEEEKHQFIRDYLGNTRPHMAPIVFAKNITSAEYENGGFVFSPKGNEVFFFSIINKGKYILHYSKLVNNYWLEPTAIFHKVSCNDFHPFFSDDGLKIFFGSDRNLYPNLKTPYANIWMSEKVNNIWSEPQPLPAIINTGYENCGSLSRDNKFYFRRVSKTTRGDIYQSNYLNEEFSKPVKLPKEINTDYDESHPAISPDGSYIIFSSKRPGGLNNGKDDLWISFIIANGEWSKCVNMGREVNNGNNTSCASITPDGKYIFFIRLENGKGVSYWASTNFINRLKPLTN